MTIQKDEVQLRKQAMVKHARGAVRTHYNTIGDRELNDVLPEAEKEFDRLVQKGILPGEAEISDIVIRARAAFVRRQKALSA